MGQTNINTKTGIRYGVIHQNNILQAWTDNSEPINSNTCPHCGDEPKSGNSIYQMKRCPTCYSTLKDEDFDYSEPIGFKLEDNKYIAFQTSDDGDILIIKSPYYTRCQFCSPCAPGAGYITKNVEKGIKAYCFGHDWFEDGKAPYNVYSVKTNEKILPID